MDVACLPVHIPHMSYGQRGASWNHSGGAGCESACQPKCAMCWGCPQRGGPFRSLCSVAYY